MSLARGDLRMPDRKLHYFHLLF